MHDLWRHSEQAAIQKSHVNEAEYAIDDRTALSLFDCIVPRLREHTIFKIRPTISIEMKDMEVNEKVEMMNLDMEVTMRVMQKEIDRLS